jgi:hypothetical protein
MAPPSGYGLYVRSKKHKFVNDFILSLSKHDKDFFLKYYTVNFHELSHFWQVITSVAGVQIMEAIYYSISQKLKLLAHINQFKLPLLDNNSFPEMNNILDAIRKSEWEADTFFTGMLPKHYVKFMVTDKGIPIYAHKNIQKLGIVEYDPWLLLVFEPDNPDKMLFIGYKHLLEAYSYSLETQFLYTLCNGLDEQPPSWFPMEYGDTYKWLDHVINKNFLKAKDLNIYEFSLLKNLILELSLNPGSINSSRNDSVNIGAFKLWRILPEVFNLLNRYRRTVDINEIQISIESIIHKNWDYAPLQNSYSWLLRNSENRLNMINLTVPENSISIAGEAIVDFYNSQKSIFDFYSPGQAYSKIFIDKWGVLPKPPLSICLTDTVIPKKVFVAKDPVRGAKWLRFLFLIEIIEQAFNNKTISCPIKINDIFCPFKNDDCGHVADFSVMGSIKKCIFYLIIDSITSSGEVKYSVIDDIDFIAGLFAYNEKIDGSY